MKDIASPAQRDEQIHIGKLIHTLFGYKRYFIIALFVAILATALVMIFVPREYKIEGRLQLISGNSGIGSELKALQSSALGGMFGTSSSGVNADDETVIMLSRRILTETVQKNDLQITMSGWDGWRKSSLYGNNAPYHLTFSGDFLAQLPDPIEMKIKQEGNETTATIASNSLKKATHKFQSLPAVIPTPWGKITINKGTAWNEDTHVNAWINPLSAVFEEYENTLSIRPIEKGSDIIQIRIAETNIQRGSTLVNALMNNYINYSKSIKLLESDVSEQFVEDKLAQVTISLNQLEKDIELYKRKNHIPDISAYGSVVYSGSEETNNRLIELKTQMKMLDYATNYLLDPKNEYAIAPNVNYGDEGISTYNRLMFERSKLLDSSEPTNPIIQSLNKQLKEQREVLIATMREARHNMDITIGELQKENAKYTARLNELPTQEKEYIEMRRLQRTQESLYLFLLQKKQEKELSNAPDEQAARVLDAAYSSYRHVFPKGSIMLPLFLALFLFLTVIVIVTKEYILKKTIDQESLSDILDIAPWGNFTDSDSVKRLRRFIHSGHEKKTVILITSSIPGEGKSFFSTHLTESFKEIGQQVLLIDLKDSLAYSPALLKKIEEARSTYQYVFIVAPPLSESSIAFDLSPHTDYTFFLCRIGLTLKKDLSALNQEIRYNTLGKTVVIVNQK